MPKDSPGGISDKERIAVLQDLHKKLSPNPMSLNPAQKALIAEASPTVLTYKLKLTDNAGLDAIAKKAVISRSKLRDFASGVKIPTAPEMLVLARVLGESDEVLASPNLPENRARMRPLT